MKTTFDQGGIVLMKFEKCKDCIYQDNCDFESKDESNCGFEHIEYNFMITAKVHIRSFIQAVDEENAKIKFYEMLQFNGEEIDTTFEISNEGKAEVY
jgi:hypothetical protein